MECTWNLENFTLGLIAAQSDFLIFALGLITVQNDFQIFELGLIAVLNDFQIFRAWPYCSAK